MLDPMGTHACPATLLTGARLWLEEGPADGLALALSGDSIAALGPEAELRHAFPHAREERLPGGTLLPGLLEGHVHVELLGQRQRQVDLTGAASLAEALDRIGAWAARHPEGWILGLGWDQNGWGAFPTAAELDRVTAGRPACLRRIDCHSLWVNGAALRQAGIDATTPDPEGGSLLRDASGAPSGILVDHAQALVQRVIPPAPAREREACILAGLSALRALGFTSVCDMGLGLDAEGLELYRRLALAEALPARVFAYLLGEPELPRAELSRRRATDTGLFQVQGVKYFADGALGSRGARLLAPYADAPESLGLWTTDFEALRGSVAEVLRAGYQPSIHAIGDAAVRAVLDLYEALGPFPGLPPRLEHAQVVAPADWPRFGALGVAAAVQPRHCTDEWSWTPLRLGPERASEAYPWQPIRAGGALLGLGSDAPIAEAEPFGTLASAESRRDARELPQGGYLPEHALSRAEAVDGYTRANAELLGRKDLGRLAPGAKADLCWVEADLARCSVPELRRLRAGRTWLNGRS
jgi:predicted amidohydrolase YtcJ